MTRERVAVGAVAVILLVVLVIAAPRLPWLPGAVFVAGVCLYAIGRLFDRHRLSDGEKQQGRFKD